MHLETEFNGNTQKTKAVAEESFPYEKRVNISSIKLRRSSVIKK